MKCKELRMVIIISILCLVAVGGSIYFLLNDTIAKGIIGLFIALILVSMLLTKYTLRVYEDYVVIYVLKAIGILPILIDFSSIKEYTKVSKHKVVLTHTRKETLYIVNADAFITKLDSKYTVYLQNHKG